VHDQIVDRVTDRRTGPARLGLDDPRCRKKALLSSTASSAASGIVEEPGDADAPLLARDMLDVHGAEAATVARHNARAAALAGQIPQAKSWIKVLALIQQQQQTDRSLSPHGPDRSPS